jgi:hypothetical protein
VNPDQVDMRYITDYLNRAWYIFKNEGVFSLFSKIFTSYLFSCREYYLRQHFSTNLDKTVFLPRVRDVEFEVITSNKTADERARRTGFDFRNQVLHGRQRLDAGAIAFCIFIHNRLASITWLAPNQRAKNIINPLPFKVDFAARQQCSSGAETVTEYRGMGLMKYLWFQRNNYMIQHNIKMLIGTDATSNKAILKVQSAFPSRISARARYIRFLWWQYWKETPCKEE